MLEQDKQYRIALLIDFDNYSNTDFIGSLISELEETGDILIKKAYYSNFNDGKLKDKCIEHQLTPVMEPSYSGSKNAVDIQLTISVMDLLKKDYIDCFCIASSDMDFAPIIKRIKEDNRKVIGSGREDTKPEYKKLFDRFINAKKIKPQEKKDDKNTMKLINIVNDIIKNNANEKGEVNFSILMNQIYNRIPDFDPKYYGASNNKAAPFFAKHLSKYYKMDINGTTHVISMK